MVKIKYISTPLIIRTKTVDDLKTKNVKAMTVEIIVDKEKCIGCGKCYDKCPKGPRIWKEDADGKYYAYDLSDCHNCKICVGVCPNGAIKVNLIKEVLDRQVNRLKEKFK